MDYKIVMEVSTSLAGKHLLVVASEPGMEILPFTYRKREGNFPLFSLTVGPIKEKEENFT